MEALTTIALTISHATVQSMAGLAIGSLLSFVNIQLWQRQDIFNPTQLDQQMVVNFLTGGTTIIKWSQFFETFLEFVSNLSLTCLAYAYVVSMVVTSGTYTDPAAGLAFLVTSVFSNLPLMLDLVTMVAFIYEQLAALLKKESKKTEAIAQPDTVSQLGIRPSPLSSLNARAGNNGFHR